MKKSEQGVLSETAVAWRGGKALVSVHVAANMLAVSDRTVWRMIADGELQAVRVRGCTRLRMEEILNYSETGRL
jgi:excisionase family DNA binding protein